MCREQLYPAIFSFQSPLYLFIISRATFFNCGNVSASKIHFSFPTEGLSIGVSSQAVNIEIWRFLINFLLSLKSEETEAVESVSQHSEILSALKMMVSVNLFSLDLFYFFKFIVRNHIWDGTNSE